MGAAHRELAIALGKAILNAGVHWLQVKSGTSEEHLDPPFQFDLTCVETGHPGRLSLRFQTSPALERFVTKHCASCKSSLMRLG